MVTDVRNDWIIDENVSCVKHGNVTARTRGRSATRAGHISGQVTVDCKEFKHRGYNSLQVVFRFHDAFHTLFMFLVGLPSALHERPGQNERSVLSQLFLLLFRCFSYKKHIFRCFHAKHMCFSWKAQVLFTKSATFHEKCKMSFRVISKYRSFDKERLIMSVKSWIPRLLQFLIYPVVSHSCRLQALRKF